MFVLDFVLSHQADVCPALEPSGTRFNSGKYTALVSNIVLIVLHKHVLAVEAGFFGINDVASSKRGADSHRHVLYSSLHRLASDHYWVAEWTASMQKLLEDDRVLVWRGGGKVQDSSKGQVAMVCHVAGE